MKRISALSSFAISFCCALAVMSCSSSNQSQFMMQATEVPVATVAEGEGITQNQYSCAIEGVANVEIRPQVSGYLSKIYIDEGAFVKAGQALFKIDDRSYTQQYHTAKAAVLAAEASLANAKIDLERKKELARNKIVSDLQVRESEAVYQSAEAVVAQAKAAAETARINLEFCTIKAPVSGYVGRFPYRLGSLVGPTSPTALTFLSDIHQVYAYFSMSENEFNTFQARLKGNNLTEKLSSGDSVTLIKSSGEAYAIKGRIDAIEGQFNKNTGSISLRAVFDNKGGELRSGNTGRVVLEQIHRDVVLVPVTSTVSVQDKIYAFSIDTAGKVLQLPIEVFGKTGNNYMVKEGIRAGDKIITAGIERLQSGMPVVEMKKQASTNPNSVTN